MKLQITIKGDNAAFEDSPGSEFARILTRLAGQLDGLDCIEAEFPLFDVNGNKVGEAVVTA